MFSANVQEMMYHQVMKRTYHGDSVSDRVQRKVKKIIKVIRGAIEKGEGESWRIDFFLMFIFIFFFSFLWLFSRIMWRAR